MLGSNSPSKSLILVTKCHKSSSWVVGSFNNNNAASDIRANVTITSPVAGGDESYLADAIVMRNGPNENDSTRFTGVKNQCLFVTGWRLYFRETLFSRDVKLKAVQTSQLSAPQIRDTHSGRVGDRSSNGNISHSDSSSSSSSPGMQEADINGFIPELNEDSLEDLDNDDIEADVDCFPPRSLPEVSMLFTSRSSLLSFPAARTP